LQRLEFTWQRARDYVRSPDPTYEAKLALVEAARQAAQQRPGEIVVLYLDEITIYRQPTLSNAYAAAGGEDQPLAVRSHASNTQTRVVGTLNHLCGKVFHLRASNAS
jgi:hypothetical protein